MSKQQPGGVSIEHFRILVTGSANAGKATILDKVCHAHGRKPDCFDKDGNKVEAQLAPSILRGERDIENYFQYPTARGFAFHVSCGFEAGSATEMDRVKKFIKERTKRERLKDRLHAIWYCLSTSGDRVMTDGEMSLFEIATGNVPVIAIFTKMDALDTRAFVQLLWDGYPPREAFCKRRSVAMDKFERDYLPRLDNVMYKPASNVQLRDMHKEEIDCDELFVRTSEALDGETLKLFDLCHNQQDSCALVCIAG